MEKKEKKSDLEGLLNTLIQRGWKPFGEGIHRSNYKSVRIHKNYKSKKPYAIFYTDNHSHWKVLRQVTSKESGLWQFVCENYLIELNGDEIEKKYKSEGEYPLRYEKHYGVYHSDLCRQEFIKYKTPEFWIIESALCDEDKLEEFLLQNIKINDAND